MLSASVVERFVVWDRVPEAIRKEWEYCELPPAENCERLATCDELDAAEDLRRRRLAEGDLVPLECCGPTADMFAYCTADIRWYCDPPFMAKELMCIPSRTHISCREGLLAYQNKNASDSQHMALYLREYYVWLSQHSEEILLESGGPLATYSSLDDFQYWIIAAANTHNFTCESLLYPLTRACCPGFYCNSWETCMRPCAVRGGYCPASDTQTPNKTHCKGTGKPSYSYMVGCGGTSSEYLECPAGYYCPDASQSVKCPVGSYCPAGYTRDIKCSWFHRCEQKGNAAPGVLFIFSMLAIGFVVLAFVLFLREPTKKLYKRAKAWWKGPAPIPDEPREVKLYFDAGKGDPFQQLALLESSPHDFIEQMDEFSDDMDASKMICMATVDMDGVTYSVYGERTKPKKAEAIQQSAKLRYELARQAFVLRSQARATTVRKLDPQQLAVTRLLDEHPELYLKPNMDMARAQRLVKEAMMSVDATEAEPKREPFPPSVADEAKARVMSSTAEKKAAITEKKEAGDFLDKVWSETSSLDDEGKDKVVSSTAEKKQEHFGDAPVKSTPAVFTKTKGTLVHGKSVVDYMVSVKSESGGSSLDDDVSVSLSLAKPGEIMDNASIIHSVDGLAKGYDSRQSFSESHQSADGTLFGWKSQFAAQPMGEMPEVMATVDVAAVGSSQAFALLNLVNLPYAEDRQGITLLDLGLDDIDEDDDTDAKATLKPMTSTDARDEVGTKIQDALRKYSTTGKAAGTRSTPVVPTFSMDIGFQEMGLYLKGSGLCVVQPISGRVLRGSVTAVMGPSGAGKTSFMFALSGKSRSYAQREGRILVNGQALSGELSDVYSDAMGFVPQSDIMSPFLTVRETLRYYARLRNGKADIKAVVNEALDTLGLTRVADFVIGDASRRGISGGQKKRVNIGMEMVAAPRVLFLDEPTSGLDATTSGEVMGALRLLADTSEVNVICVLHQPRFEIFMQFDNLILLAKGGMAVYCGPTAQAAAHATYVTGVQPPKHTNPADYLMDVIATHGEDLHKAWLKLEEEKGEEKEKETEEEKDKEVFTPRIPPTLWAQTYLVAKRRTLEMYTRRIGDFIAQALTCAIAGVAIAFICDSTSMGQVPTSAFMMVLVVGVLAINSSLTDFNGERLVYYREASSGLSRVAYWLGCNLTFLVSGVLLPFCFVCFYFAIFQPRAPFITYVGVIVVYWITMQSAAHLVSIIITRDKATVVAGAVTVLWAICCGYNPTLESLTAAVTVWNPCRWALEAVWLNEMHFWSEVYDKKTKSKAEAYGWTLGSLWDCIGYLLLISLIIRLLCLVALYRVNRSKQI